MPNNTKKLWYPYIKINKPYQCALTKMLKVHFSLKINDHDHIVIMYWIFKTLTVNQGNKKVGSKTTRKSID